MTNKQLDGSTNDPFQPKENKKQSMNKGSVYQLEVCKGKCYQLQRLRNQFQENG